MLLFQEEALSVQLKLYQSLASLPAFITATIKENYSELPDSFFHHAFFFDLEGEASRFIWSIQMPFEAVTLPSDEEVYAFNTLHNAREHIEILSAQGMKLGTIDPPAAREHLHHLSGALNDLEQAITGRTNDRALGQYISVLELSRRTLSYLVFWSQWQIADFQESEERALWFLQSPEDANDQESTHSSLKRKSSPTAASNTGSAKFRRTRAGNPPSNGGGNDETSIEHTYQKTGHCPACMQEGRPDAQDRCSEAATVAPLPDFEGLGISEEPVQQDEPAEIQPDSDPRADQKALVFRHILNRQTGMEQPYAHYKPYSPLPEGPPNGNACYIMHSPCKNPTFLAPANQLAWFW